MLTDASTLGLSINVAREGEGPGPVDVSLAS